MYLACYKEKIFSVNDMLSTEKLSKIGFVMSILGVVSPTTTVRQSK